jgi:alanine racemase
MVRPTVARIDLHALQSNYRRIVAHLTAEGQGGAPGVIAVVKANAYGHGAGQVARALEDAGADLLACADIEEGAVLRSAGVRADVLVFGALSVSDLDGLFDCNLTPTISTPGAARAVQAAAAKHGQRVRYHLKIDTGMNRLGFRFDNLRRTLPELLASPNLELAAVYTHFATADDPESALFQQQHARFERALAEIATLCPGLRLRTAGASDPDAIRNRQSRSTGDLPSVATGDLASVPRSVPGSDPGTDLGTDSGSDPGTDLGTDSGDRRPYVHAANSAALLRDSRVWYERVRPGLLLYGIAPPPLATTIGLRPVMSLDSRIVAVKGVRQGEGVGYGVKFTAGRATSIAIVPAGYADGLDLRLAGRGFVLIRGRRAPIVGSVCMDMLMADVTGLDVSPGDEVVIIGSQGDDRIDVREIAAEIGTIPYEVLCRVGTRIERLYT